MAYFDVNHRGNYTLSYSLIDWILMILASSENELTDFRFLPQEYGKYRKDILEHFVCNVLPSTRVLLDPLAGTASLLPYCQKMGISSYYSEILPVHKYVNSAKTLEVWKCIVAYEKSSHNSIENFIMDFFSHFGETSLLISDSWFHDEALASLRLAWQASDGLEEKFSDFIKAVILLTVRSYSSTWSSTSNAYWHRPGGISLHKPLEEIVSEIMARFRKLWQFYGDPDSFLHTILASFQTNDAKSVSCDEPVDTIITSPPYPNRFDYARMFGPELFFLEEVGACKIEEITSKQIATNSVRHYFPSDDELDYLYSRSESLQDFLEQVLKLGKKKEKNYYHRYFVKYYLDLFRTIDHLSGLLSEKGTIHFVVQNNIHRGELNALTDYSAECLAANGLKVDHSFRKLRRHQGTRNISKEHSILVKKHHEIIIKAERR